MTDALIVWGGWDGHHPEAFAERCAEMLRDEGLAVELSGSLEALSEGARELSLIVPIWTMGTIAPEPLAALLDAVESGVGLAGFHGGMGDAFRDATDFQFMVGGQFVAHPDGIKDYEVTITDREHEITRGLADFQITSEQYYMHVDPSNHVLATTVFEPASAPWVAGHGNAGRLDAAARRGSRLLLLARPPARRPRGPRGLRAVAAGDDLGRALARIHRSVERNPHNNRMRAV